MSVESRKLSAILCKRVLNELARSVEILVLESFLYLALLRLLECCKHSSYHVPKGHASYNPNLQIARNKTHSLALSFCNSRRLKPIKIRARVHILEILISLVLRGRRTNSATHSEMILNW